VYFGNGQTDKTLMPYGGRRGGSSSCHEKEGRKAWGNPVSKESLPTLSAQSNFEEKQLLLLCASADFETTTSSPSVFVHGVRSRRFWVVPMGCLRNLEQLRTPARKEICCKINLLRGEILYPNRHHANIISAWTTLSSTRESW
jgi:hypothetical protein